MNVDMPCILRVVGKIRVSRDEEDDNYYNNNNNNSDYNELIAIVIK